jgi:ketosteroid isomerase-like protein
VPSASLSQNIEQLRAGIEAFNSTGELDTSNLAPDFEMHQASSIIDTEGVFLGPDALQGALKELKESFEDLSYEAEQFLETPDGRILVFIRARARGRGSGVEIDDRIAWLWTFRGDKAVRLDVYEEREEALEDVGMKK